MSSDCKSTMMELIREAQNGKAQEMDCLLRMHQGMIFLLAGRLCCECTSREELIQAGNLGFMRALSHYDISSNAKLSTYAVPWILGEMRRAVRRTECFIYSLDQTIDGDGQTLYDILSGEQELNIQYIDLHLALEKLNREQQLVICLRYYRDKTQLESAALLGKSQTQISRMERHALDTLHKLLS